MFTKNIYKVSHFYPAKLYDQKYEKVLYERKIVNVLSQSDNNNTKIISNWILVRSIGYVY